MRPGMFESADGAPAGRAHVASTDLSGVFAELVGHLFQERFCSPSDNSISVYRNRGQAKPPKVGRQKFNSLEGSQ
jgi:hypothetical protein